MSTTPHSTEPTASSAAAATPSIADGKAASAPGTVAPSPAVSAGASHSYGKRRKRLIRILAVLAGIVILWFGTPIVIRALITVSTDDAYVNGHVTFVAPRVPGQVTRVLVDDNNRVEKGDLLVVLDKEPYQIQVELKKAAVDTAKASVDVAEDETRATVAKARSNRFRLEHAMEDVRNQLALLNSQVAQLDVQKANLVLAEQNFSRSQSLVGKGAVSQQQYDQDKASLDVAKNQVTAAQQNIQQTRASLGLPPNIANPLDVPHDLDQTFSTVRQALGDLLSSVAPLGVHPSSYNLTPGEIIEEFYRQDPQGDLDRIFAKLVANAPAIKEAKARLELAQADLDQAELNLRYCDVYAEISGQVIRRNVNPGNNVQAGQSLMAIRSLTEIWIDANFKETQLDRMRIGQRAELEVDMYGRRHLFEGRISGFTFGTGSTLALLPAQNATGNFIKVVQRLPVRIELTDYDPEKDPLFIGLSVVPHVFVREKPVGPHAGEFLQGHLINSAPHETNPPGGNVAPQADPSATTVPAAAAADPKAQPEASSAESTKAAP